MPVGKPFEKGASPNPRGRPIGMARAIRERLGGSPDELLTVLLDIAKDEKARPADRTNAARALMEHGWGKAASFAAIEGGDPLELDEVSEAISALVDELSARRDAKGATVAAPSQ